MDKVGPTLEDLSRRERRQLRQLWRYNPRIQLLASEPTSTIQLVHRRRAKKACRRRKAIQLPDALSPSKIKKIKLAHGKTGGTILNNSSGLESSNSITSLFDELRNLFGQGPNDIRVIADMEATYDSLEARFPAGPITPPNSSLDLKGLSAFEFSSSVLSGSESVLTISASSSSEYESSHKNPAQIFEDPFIVIGTPLPIKGESISETHTASTSCSPACGLKPSTMASENPRTPTRKVTSSLATPPDTDRKKSPAIVNTTRKHPDSRSKFMSACDPVLIATGKSDPASKKPLISRKPSLLPETVQRKVPGKIHTPDSITRVRTAVPAKSELGATSPSVKVTARVQTDPKIRKLPSKPVLSSLKLRAPHVNTATKPIASDTKVSKRGSTQQMTTTTSTPNKPASDVKKIPLNHRMLAVAQKASTVSITSNKSSGTNHTPPKRSTTLSTAHNVKFSTAKSPITQTASKIANVVMVPPSGSVLDEKSTEWISSEHPHKISTPYLLPIPGHSAPTIQPPVLTSAAPTVAEPTPANGTPLCFSSVGNSSTSASSTTSLCSTNPERKIPTRPPHVSFAVPVVPSRSSPSLSQRSCASRTTSLLTHVASPAEKYAKISGTIPAGTPESKSSLITSVEIINPRSPTPSVLTEDTRDVDSARRSNLMRMFRVRWTAGDDQLPFNTKAMGGLAGDDTQNDGLGNSAKNDAKIVHRRPPVLDTLNAFLWR